MPRLLAWSVGVHVLILLISFLLPAEAEEEMPRERTVKLMLTRRVVSKKIVPDEIKESAPGTDRSKNRQVFDNEAFLKIAKQSLSERSRPKDDSPSDRTSRDKGNEPKYDDMLRSPKSDTGRQNRPDAPSVNDLRGNKRSDNDKNTRDGNMPLMGRDGLNSNPDDRNPLNPPGTRRSNPGNRGSGVTGFVNVRSRRVVYTPPMTLPSKYSRLGLSYTARFSVTVSPEGLIIACSIIGTTGDAQLDVILTGFARRYRLEAKRGGVDETGTIALSVRPR